MAKLLHVEDLNIEFHDHLVPETVVYDFDLDMEKGEIVGLVGESGSGKSMSALAIAGLLSRHDMKKKGSILFEGKEILNCPRQELRSLQGDEICMVFQEPMTSLDPVKKIGWQVEESLRIHEKLTDVQRRERAMEALRAVELEDVERVYNSYPHELSGGMRQRVMIAAAIVGHPRLLICDEPTTALDVSVQAQIVKLLKKINKDTKTAILFISHDLSLIRQLCERVLVMKGGYIVEAGSTEAIFNSPREEYTKKLIAAIPKCEDEIPPEVDYTDNIVSVNNLSVSFKKGKTVFDAVKNVNFEVKAGEIVGLVGESGSGKSTIAKALVGINPNYRGEIIRNCQHPQMIFQDPYGSLNPSKNIGFILEEPLRNYRPEMSRQQRHDRACEMLKLVGLPEEFISRYPSELSGGQKQRVCIAAALVLNPSFIIADEPVSALDVTIQAEILNLLLKLHEELQVSILFISHDLRVVYKMCDRIIVLKSGEIVEEGIPEEIYKNPQNEYTKILLESAGLCQPKFWPISTKQLDTH